MSTAIAGQRAEMNKLKAESWNKFGPLDIGRDAFRFQNISITAPF